MKNIKLVRGVVGLVILLMQSVCQAEDPQAKPLSGGGGGISYPLSIPELHDRALMRELGLKVARWGYRDVDVQSINNYYPGTSTFTNGVGRNADDMQDQLFDVHFVFQVVNPKDLITGRNWLFADPDDISHPSFFGETVPYSGLDTNRPLYVLNQYETPLTMLSNVVSATIVALNTDGTSSAQKIPVTIRNGVPWYGPWYVGQMNGLFEVTLDNGSVRSSISYPLYAVTNVPPASVKDDPEWKISGHYHYRVLRSMKVTNLYQVQRESYELPDSYITNEVAVSSTVDILVFYNDNGVTMTERPYEMEVESLITHQKRTVPLSTTGTTVVHYEVGEWKGTPHFHKFPPASYLYTGENVSSGGSGSTSTTTNSTGSNNTGDW